MLIYHLKTVFKALLNEMCTQMVKMAFEPSLSASLPHSVQIPHLRDLRKEKENETWEKGHTHIYTHRHIDTHT